MNPMSNQTGTAPAVGSSALLGCWAVAIQLQKRLGNGSLDLALRLGKWDAASEQEAVGKAVDDALENNNGYTVGVVTRLMLRQPNS